MKDKDLTDALKNIIEKELKIFSKLIPKDTVKNIEDSILPQIEKIVEQSGYVKKTKYENLKRIIDNLEKRISDLEKN
mgnify:FL=1